MLIRRIGLAFLCVLMGFLCTACDPSMFEIPEPTPYAYDSMVRHKPGEVFESIGFEISYIGVEVRDTLDDMTAAEGFDYYVFEFEYKNIYGQERNIYYGCFACYADNTLTTQIYNYDGIIKGTLTETGQSARGTVAFLVPEDAELVETIFQYGMEDERLVFSVE